VALVDQVLIRHREWVLIIQVFIAVRTIVTIGTMGTRITDWTSFLEDCGAGHRRISDLRTENVTVDPNEIGTENDRVGMSETTGSRYAITDDASPIDWLQFFKIVSVKDFRDSGQL
jgi:hypothetical protein